MIQKIIPIAASITLIGSASLTVTANQTSGQKNEPRSTSAQIPYSVHHNELQ